MNIHCFKVNGDIKPITYVEFIKSYNNKKQAQADWQNCREQIKLNNCRNYHQGKFYKFQNNNSIYYFCWGISCEDLKILLGYRLPSKNKINIEKLDTKYKVDKEIYNENLKLFVKEIYPAKELLNSKFGDYLSKYINLSKNKRKFILLDNDEINVTSNRLRLFKTKGIKCVNCGLEGQWFYKCRQENDVNYHLELFVEKNGKLLKMTKDHILPSSKGGADHLSNMQVMCEECNGKKGNNLNLKDRLKGISKEELAIAKLTAINKFCEKNYSNKMTKQELIKGIIKIIVSQDEKKLVKDKSILKKLGKIIGIN